MFLKLIIDGHPHLEIDIPARPGNIAPVQVFVIFFIKYILYACQHLHIVFKQGCIAAKPGMQ